MVCRKNSLQKKGYGITFCTHMVSHAIWVDEITGVMTVVKKISKKLNLF